MSSAIEVTPVATPVATPRSVASVESKLVGLFDKFLSDAAKVCALKKYADSLLAQAVVHMASDECKTAAIQNLERIFERPFVFDDAETEEPAEDSTEEPVVSNEKPKKRSRKPKATEETPAAAEEPADEKPKKRTKKPKATEETPAAAEEPAADEKPKKRTKKSKETEEKLVVEEILEENSA